MNIYNRPMFFKEKVHIKHGALTLIKPNIKDFTLGSWWLIPNLCQNIQTTMRRTYRIGFEKVIGKS